MPSLGLHCKLLSSPVSSGPALTFLHLYYALHSLTISLSECRHLLSSLSILIPTHILLFMMICEYVVLMSGFRQLLSLLVFTVEHKLIQENLQWFIK